MPNKYSRIIAGKRRKNHANQEERVFLPTFVSGQEAIRILIQPEVKKGRIIKPQALTPAQAAEKKYQEELQEYKKIKKSYDNSYIWFASKPVHPRIKLAQNKLDAAHHNLKQARIELFQAIDNYKNSTKDYDYSDKSYRLMTRLFARVINIDEYIKSLNIDIEIYQNDLVEAKRVVYEEELAERKNANTKNSSCFFSCGESTIPASAAYEMSYCSKR